MNTFPLTIVTPAEARPARDVISVDLPGEEGRLTIMAHHEPLVCLLRQGVAQIRTSEGDPQDWVIEGGTLTVSLDSVTLLTRDARPAPRRP